MFGANFRRNAGDQRVPSSHRGPRARQRGRRRGRRRPRRPDVAAVDAAAIGALPATLLEFQRPEQQASWSLEGGARLVFLFFLKG